METDNIYWTLIMNKSHNRIPKTIPDEYHLSHLVSEHCSSKSWGSCLWVYNHWVTQQKFCSYPRTLAWGSGLLWHLHLSRIPCPVSYWNPLSLLLSNFSGTFVSFQLHKLLWYSLSTRPYPLLDQAYSIDEILMGLSSKVR